jgi:3-oxoacyl-[acyl-carrier-protein] synthase II
MNFYIKSTASISPASLPAAKQPEETAIRCADPDLSGIVDPKLSRRMSHVIKLGIATAMQALKAAGDIQPDAIVTGTAYGCLEDTGIFLKKQVQQNETMLTPTAFIQSTHNTVGGQIGLLLHCNGYNNTFVHRGFSFEHALQDGIMLLEDHEAETVLLGAVDEITDTSHILLSRFGLYENGAVAGEGAAFFVLSSQPSQSDYAILKSISTLYKPENTDEIISHIQDFLAEAGLQANDISILLTGENGDQASDRIYTDIRQGLFQNTENQTFKAACGEYPTASSYALSEAANILKNISGQQKHLLIYNHYQNIHHSFMLLSSC